MAISAAEPVMAAKLCAPAPSVAFPLVARSEWVDLAKFAFQVGIDLDVGNMELVTRLRRFPSFSSLRADSSAWAGTYQQSVQLGSEVVSLRTQIMTLSSLCRELDDAGLGGKPLDSAAWIRRMADVRGTLDGVLIHAQGGVDTIVSGSFRRKLESYAQTAGAAAKSYADARFPAPPSLPVGPDPVQVAAYINQLWAQWRAIMEDLAYVARTLPKRPDPDSEKVLADIATAMPILARSESAAAALTANVLASSDFDHFISGNYFYDSCSIPEGRKVLLQSFGFEPRVLTRVAPQRVLALMPGKDDANQYWRLVRVGLGYWAIRGIDDSILDVANDPGSYPAKTAAGKEGFPGYTGQLWRCFATDLAHNYRFITNFLGEDWSLADNMEKVYMARTDNKALPLSDTAQLWHLVLPQ